MPSFNPFRRRRVDAEEKKKSTTPEKNEKKLVDPNIVNKDLLNPSSNIPAIKTSLNNDIERINYLNMGGRYNSHIKRIVLNKIDNGKFKRDTVPFVFPNSAIPNCNLVFYEEKERCLHEKILFEDPEFPAQSSSLYIHGPSEEEPEIKWLRPNEIANDPQFFVDGESRFDAIQGHLGDCWLIAAIANLATRKELFYRVVPPDQSFTRKNYAGIFHFHFWNYGKWVDVVIDDRLPTVDGKLYYIYSKSKNEFWSALLEKAYAKLYGSYEALEGGLTTEALEDFTGGLTEYFQIKDMDVQEKLKLSIILIRGFRRGSLFGCSVYSDQDKIETITKEGIVREHAYSITAVHSIYHRVDGETLLLRLRNPWGDKHEWKGAWSDKSKEWEDVSEKEKDQMEFILRDDGEFWMSFKDFCIHFELLEICHFGPEVMNEIMELTGMEIIKNKWTHFVINGKWNKKHETAGGCRENKATFPNNPQYAIRLELSSKSIKKDGKCTVIIALLQKYRRELKSQDFDTLNIGFNIYKIDSQTGRKSRSFFKQNKPLHGSSISEFRREIAARFRLLPGNYLIVPFADKPNDEADFLIRVYSSGIVEGNQIT